MIGGGGGRGGGGGGGGGTDDKVITADLVANQQLVEHLQDTCSHQPLQGRGGGGGRSVSKV